MSFLEECWEEREEKTYKQIFGDIGPGIYPLSTEVFNRMSADTVDPRWLTHSVFKCPPAENRKTWAYITSGMSNPWEAESPEEYSGLGVEFLMEANTEAIWAPGSRYFCRKIFSSFPAGKNRQKLRDRLCLRRPDSSASPRSDPAWGRNLGSRMT